MIMKVADCCGVVPCDVFIRSSWNKHVRKADLLEFELNHPPVNVGELDYTIVYHAPHYIHTLF